MRRDHLDDIEPCSHCKRLICDLVRAPWCEMDCQLCPACLLASVEKNDDCNQTCIAPMRDWLRRVA